MPFRTSPLPTVLLLLAAVLPTFGRGKNQLPLPFIGVWTNPESTELSVPRPYPVFPSLYFTSRFAKLPDGVSGQFQDGAIPPFIQERLPAIANNQILAFYGSPASKKMGILGVYPKEELTKMLLQYAESYDEVNGPRGIIPSFYIVYGTCWPKGDIGYLDASITEDYIRFAAARGILVFIDHQIGRYTVEESMDRILPFLKYPNVHLALDPEWRTQKPMQEIGSITAAELNAAQRRMQEYIVSNDIPGLKMLVVHQFQDKMISGRETVRADFERILLIHTADGFGAPALKRYSYAQNAKATNIPLKGFKLFLKSGVPGAGFDEPLLIPSQVLTLDPEPVLIMYQ